MFTDLNVEHDNSVESLAAELTSAAYPVLLRSGLAGSWVELELGLWKVLADTVGAWKLALPPRDSADAYNRWRSRLIAKLTDGAVFVAREQRVRELFQLRPGLREAFSSAIGRACSEAAPELIGAHQS